MLGQKAVLRSVTVQQGASTQHPSSAVHISCQHRSPCLGPLPTSPRPSQNHSAALTARVSLRPVRAAAAVRVEDFTKDAPTADGGDGPVLACPICFRPFTGRLSCSSCARTFPMRQGYADLLVSSSTSGAAAAYTESAPTSQSLFESPLVAAAYERGWRQSFSWAGFPGADAEFAEAQRLLAPARGGVLLDASCGSGLFTRRFAASGAYSSVVACDYSEAMLLQTSAYLQAERPPPAVPLVRCDIARLPFPTGSLAAVHAGAALHCWPSPAAGLAEVARVLRPGGVFVASTFLSPAAPLGEVLGDAAVAPLAALIGRQRAAAGQAFKWWTEPELRALCGQVGLEGFARVRTRQYIMLAVSKPQAAGGWAA